MEIGYRLEVAGYRKIVLRMFKFIFDDSALAAMLSRLLIFL